MAFGNIGTIWAEVGLNTKKLDAGVTQAKIKLATADRSLRTMGQRLTANSTRFMMAGGVMVAAAGAAGVAVTKMASDFETSMRNVNSIMRVSEDEFADISSEVLDLSKELPQAATTLANGLYDIASSGFQGADGLTVLEASARAAAAGLTTTEVSAKGITAVLNAYGLEAEEADRISDTMFRTVDKGVITFEQLSGNLGDVLGVANLANIEFEELSGAIGYMTTQGLNAEIATTALNRTILSIIDPSDELAEVMHKAGYESGEMALQQLGLAGVLGLVDEAAGGSITKLQEMFVDIRSLRGAGALLGNGIEELNGYMSDFKDTTGATNLALEEQSKALSFQLDLLKSSLTAIGITIGNEYIPKITKATKKLSAFTDENADTIVLLGDIGIKATLAVGGITLLAGALGKLRLAAMAHPVAALVAAYAGIGAVISGLASTIENDYGRALINGTNAISGISGATESWNVASKVAEEYNISLAKVLFMSRSRVYEMSDAMDELKERTVEAADAFIKKYSDKLPNATARMAEMNNQFADGALSAEAFAIGIEYLRKETKNGHKDIEELGTVTQETNVELRRMAEEMGLTGGVFDDFGEEVDDVTQSIRDLTGELFELFNINQSVDEAKQDYLDTLADEDSSLYDIQDSLEGYMSTLEEAIESDKTSIDKKIELMEEYNKLGKVAVEKGLIMRDDFAKTANELAGSIDNGIIPAFKRANESVDEYLERLKRIPRNIETAVSVRRVNEIGEGFMAGLGVSQNADGGIVGYANGGIAGRVPAAASGMVVPQTGRAIPIIAHQDETILNTSQQKNIAEWIMGKANSRPDSNGQPININIVAELDGEVIYQKTSQYLYDGQNTRSRLGA